MPGIAGVVSPLPSAARQLDLMLEAISGAGQHVEGRWSDERIGCHVGWTGLDLDTPSCVQAWNASGDVCVVFSGEEFTSPESRRICGHRPGQTSLDDAHYILARYEEHGPEFAGLLNGWFSGLIVDKRTSQALLFNDRFGIGRLYCCDTPEGFYFASEAKALLSVLPKTRRLNETALAESLSFGCVLDNRSIFCDVSLVPPASLWVFAQASLRKRGTYFSPSTWENQAPLPAAEFAVELDLCLRRIVPNYLRGPSKCAMSLTGGVDGRAVLAWGNPAPNSLPCYSFVGPFRESQDVRLARRIAQVCEQPHSTIAVGDAFVRDFPELAERCVYVSDGTMDVSGAVELYVNRAARAIAPVRITGNYGSEIVRRQVAFKPKLARQGVLDPALHRQVQSAAEAYLALRSRTHALSFIAFQQVPWHHHARLAVERSQLVVRSPFMDTELVRLLYRSPGDDSTSSATLLDLIAGRNQALASIPTDRGLARPASTLPGGLRQAVHWFTGRAEYAYDYGMPQWLTRADEALSLLGLHRLFLGRHKFYHFRLWYRHQLAQYVQSVLLDRRTLERSCFDAAALARMVRDHVRGHGNYTLEIHRALTHELSLRTLIDRWTGKARTP